MVVSKTSLAIDKDIMCQTSFLLVQNGKEKPTTK
jgi:hypothetical protein